MIKNWAPWRRYSNRVNTERGHSLDNNKFPTLWTRLHDAVLSSRSRSSRSNSSCSGGRRSVDAWRQCNQQTVIVCRPSVSLSGNCEWPIRDAWNAYARSKQQWPYHQLVIPHTQSCCCHCYCPNNCVIAIKNNFLRLKSSSIALYKCMQCTDHWALNKDDYDDDDDDDDINMTLPQWW